MAFEPPPGESPEKQSKTRVGRPRFSGWAIVSFLLMTVILVLLFFGIPFSPPASYFGPRNYLAYSVIKITNNDDFDLGNLNKNQSKAEESLADFVREQEELLRSGKFLTEAMKDPRVKNLQDLKKSNIHPNFESWLSQALEIDFKNGSTTFRIGLRGNDPEEIKSIIEAVTSAYLQEFRESERVNRQKRIESLFCLLAKYEDELRTENRELERVSGEIGAPFNKAVPLRKKANEKYIAILVDEVAKLKMARIDLEIKLAQTSKLHSGSQGIGPQVLAGLSANGSGINPLVITFLATLKDMNKADFPNPVQNQIVELSRNLETINFKCERLMKELENLSPAEKKLNVDSLAILQISNRMEPKKAIMKALSEKIAALELQKESPPRVVLWASPNVVQEEPGIQKRKSWDSPSQK